MTTVQDVLSNDSIYVKLKPLDIGKGGKWGGQIEITIVCPDTIPVNEDGEIMLCNMAAMMAASLDLYEDHEDIKEMAQNLVFEAVGGTDYVLEEKPPVIVEHVVDNVIKLNFKP